MKKITLLLGLAFLLSFQIIHAQNKSPENLLVEYELLYTYSKDSLESFYKKNKIPQIITPVENAVDMYAITYKGEWLDGSLINAKGVLYIPKTEEPKAEMAYCHGTRISVKQGYGINDLEQLVPIMHAADGYISYFPFYYGLGGGDKEHIYHHSETEALSVIYMIKACREELFEKIGTKTNGQLFLTGYSQGGHASFATHKMLESDRFPEIKITASSPMSGAYDMTGTQSKSMFQKYDRPHYLPYLLISYSYAYRNLWDGDIYSVFTPPYDKQIKKYFKQPRKMDYGVIDSILPNYPSEMIIDSLVNVFRTDTNLLFTKKLAENNLHDWKPEAPSQLCACYGDNEVMYQNTEVAYANMKAKGANVYKRMFGKHLAHNPCAPFAIMYSKSFFDNIRKGRNNIYKVRFPKRLLLNLGIMGANRKGKKKLKETGKVEEDAMSVR